MVKNTRVVAACLFTAVVVAGCSHPESMKTAVTAPAPLTVQDVNAAQQAWCDALLNIAKTHAAGGDYQSVAEGVLDNNYNYDHGKVLFNPTLLISHKYT